MPLAHLDWSQIVNASPIFLQRAVSDVPLPIAAHLFSQRQDQLVDTSPSSPPGRGPPPVQNHAPSSHLPPLFSVAPPSNRAIQTISVDSDSTAPLPQQAQLYDRRAPFDNPIQYAYPVEPPLDASDPQWLEKMFQQRHREQRFVGDNILATESVLGDVARELRIAELQLEQELKLSQAVVTLLGRLAGPRFGAWLNQRVAAGDGSLSDESDVGSYRPRQARHNDFPRISSFHTPTKRPRDDGDDNVGDSSSGEEGHGGGPKVRRDYKRRRLTLRSDLKNMPLGSPAVVLKEEPEADEEIQRNAAQMQRLWGMTPSAARAAERQIVGLDAAHEGAGEAPASPVASLAEEPQVEPEPRSAAPMQTADDEHQEPAFGAVEAQPAPRPATPPFWHANLQDPGEDEVALPPSPLLVFPAEDSPSPHLGGGIHLNFDVVREPNSDDTEFDVEQFESQFQIEVFPAHDTVADDAVVGDAAVGDVPPGPAEADADVDEDDEGGEGNQGDEDGSDDPDRFEMHNGSEDDYYSHGEGREDNEEYDPEEGSWHGSEGGSHLEDLAARGRPEELDEFADRTGMTTDNPPDPYSSHPSQLRRHFDHIVEDEYGNPVVDAGMDYDAQMNLLRHTYEGQREYEELELERIAAREEQQRRRRR